MIRFANTLYPGKQGILKSSEWEKHYQIEFKKKGCSADCTHIF